MERKNAVRLVSSMALLVWVLTLLIVVLTVSALAQWHAFSRDGLQLMETPNMLAAIVNLILVGVLGTAIGYGLWHFRSWGRWLAIVFLSLVAIDIILYVWKYPLTAGLLLLSIASFVALYFLAFNKSVKALFHA